MEQGSRRIPEEEPAFFEDYADVVAQIFVPHPHGGHAIPIAERQILALRDKAHELEQRLRELIRNGTENDEIGEKLHRSTLALFAAPDLETTLAVLSHSLKEDFAVPQVAMRLWRKRRASTSCRNSLRRPTRVREYADRSSRAVLRHRALPAESRRMVRRRSGRESFAYLPLRTEQTFGVLALGKRRCSPLHAGHRHRVPDAARRARQRGDRTLPAASRLMTAPRVLPQTCPARTRQRSTRSPRISHSRAPHTRTAYLRDVAQCCDSRATRRCRASPARS